LNTHLEHPKTESTELQETVGALGLSTFRQDQQLPGLDDFNSTNLPRQPNESGSRSVLPNPLGLSSELRRILNMSTLDGDVSVSASLLGRDNDDVGRRAERQYMWLQRYHAHLAGQEGNNVQPGAASEPLPVDRTVEESVADSAVPDDVVNRLT
jgi:hypothetical protein